MHAATADAVNYLERITATQCSGCGISWLRNTDASSSLALVPAQSPGNFSGMLGAGEGEAMGSAAGAASPSSISSTSTLLPSHAFSPLRLLPPPSTGTHWRNRMFFARIPDASVLSVVSYLSKEHDGPRLACCAAGFAWPQAALARGRSVASFTSATVVAPVLLVGAKGQQANSINGTYLPTSEWQNGRQLLRKREDPDKWLRFVQTKGAWVVSNSQNKHKNTSIGFCYAICPSGLRDDPAAHGVQWKVHDSNAVPTPGFVIQPELTSTRHVPPVRISGCPRRLLRPSVAFVSAQMVADSRPIDSPANSAECSSAPEEQNENNEDGAEEEEEEEEEEDASRMKDGDSRSVRKLLRLAHQNAGISDDVKESESPHASSMASSSSSGLRRSRRIGGGSRPPTGTRKSKKQQNQDGDGDGDDDESFVAFYPLPGPDDEDGSGDRNWRRITRSYLKKNGLTFASMDPSETTGSQVGPFGETWSTFY